MKGVIGVYSHRQATNKAVNVLYGVQHRGQESSGISASGNTSLRTWNGKGLVSNVFQDHFPNFIHPEDYAVIGCTSDENTTHNDLPPIVVQSDRYTLSLAYDGYMFKKNGGRIEDALGKIVLEEIEEHGIQTGLSNALNSFPRGYFSMVALLLDKTEKKSYLIILRDSKAVRPLYYGYNDTELYVASESAPFDILESMGVNFNERTDFPPGALLIKDREGHKLLQILKPKPAHCVFEWAYFGRPDSVIEGKTVHMVRKRLGRGLVNTHSLKELYDEDINQGKEVVLIPVPDSGRSVCIGVAEALGKPADEGVIKNAYLGRTYIIDDPEYRKKASDLKHNIIKETVKGKKVMITDDSIVRGTVSESVAKNLLQAGAKEVEFLVSYAPIFYPCFSDSKDKTLAAAEYRGESIFEIGEKVALKLPSINKVRYNTPNNILEAVGLDTENICTYCISGVSPFTSEELKP